MVTAEEKGTLPLGESPVLPAAQFAAMDPIDRAQTRRNCGAVGLKSAAGYGAAFPSAQKE